MSRTVCLLASALEYPEGGGQLWLYLNWALGLRALGCEVVWLELVPDRPEAAGLLANVRALKEQLEEHELSRNLALGFKSGAIVPEPIAGQCLSVEAAVESELLLDFQYDTPDELVRQFRTTALVDIDPGLLQIWQSHGTMNFAPHDFYFSIGETVGRPDALFPGCGVPWHYTAPPIYLPAWPVTVSGPDAAFTTVAHWWYGEMEWKGETFSNDKRASFLSFLELPALTTEKLELALALGDNKEERPFWESHGWRVRDSWQVCGTADGYRDYIRGSRGEFSCAKPSCMRLQNAWISDRTLCYLASGKPAIVQHTGPSRFLPEAEGLFRFRTMAEAASALETVESDYERHCVSARQLAEEHFDATKVLRRVLETALP